MLKKVDTTGNVTVLASGFNQNMGMAVDSNGNVYVADYTAHVIKKVDTSNNNNVTVIAGTASSSGYTGNGGQASDAKLKGPHNMIISDGQLYFAEYDNYVVRKIDLATGIIDVVAGNGTSGNTGDGGAADAATLGRVFSISKDAFDILYIAAENATKMVYTPGTLSGTVLDTSNNPVNGATVAIAGTTSSTTTDALGSFALNNVTPGNRNLTVTAAGYGNGEATAAVNGGQGVNVGNIVIGAQVSGVALNNPTLTMAIGGTPVTLTATVSPNNAANKSVTWQSSDTTIATVDNNGLVTPVAAGTATITVTTADGSKTATSLVTVTNPPAPAAPNVTADDAANVIVGLTTTMEFQIDGGSYVKYDGTNAPDLSGNRTVLVRVAADAATGTPAGASTTLTFTANPPAAPNVTADDAANVIVGLTTTLEFQIDGGSYVKYDGTNAPDLSGNRTVLVRVAADAATGTPAGAATTLTFTANPPAAPNVTADDAANVIVGLTTTLEFQIDGGSYVKYDGTNAPDLSGNRTVLVRVAADAATGTPAGAATTLTFTANPPAAPNVTADDAANVIVGLDTTMEFKVDNGSYVKYDGTNSPDLSGNRTVLVRVAADTATGTPAGADTTLTFTANPPAAPNVTADDAANVIVGLTTTMEFQIDGGSYVKYDGSNAPDLSGNRTVLVRAAADAATGTPAGASTTLTFTANPRPTAPSEPATTSSGVDVVDVLINGMAINIGVATTTKVDNRQVTTITLNQENLEALIEAEGQGAVVTLILSTNTDVVISELNGQIVKNMENNQVVLEIKVGTATYTIPTNQINIDAISNQVGKSVALQDIMVKIEIAEPTAAMVNVVENAALKGTFTIVAPPISFTINSTYGDRTITIEKFNAYVERTIAIPDEVDPSKITTGVVIDPDGTVRHVPTKIKKKDSKYYAIINSLTNSTYALVWHPIEFGDVVNHWSKTAVIDMGSRMVIDGTGKGQFSPDRNITRAEFAAILVRGLGLKLESGDSVFTDVKASDWFSSFINTAYAYNLINGYADGSFGPNDNITREQAMTMISKAMTITSLKAGLPIQSIETTLHPYQDIAKASEWAISSIADSVQSGIVTGRTRTELAPKAFITRAEVAVIIQRLLERSNLI
ncbi:DUF4073 domain-containing protein [Paenibacillus contaminans]|nr:DUF4073 domain-containing protein [Paenibacillus contaminans]